MEIKGKWFNEKLVTSIDYKPGKRFGVHPVAYRLARKSKSLRVRLWGYIATPDTFDIWLGTRVIVNLGDDFVVIDCKSKNEALKIMKEISEVTGTKVN